MATSALPRAIDALVAILRASSGLQQLTGPDGRTVKVIDGPATGDIALDDYLAIGWSGSDDQNDAAESIQNFNSAGARTRDEELVIAGVIDIWSGDDTFSAVRTRAFDVLAVVETELRATNTAPEAPTLNGVVLWAHLTRTQLRQYFTDQGARVALGFTVSCHARI
jgi:hypothetical protein